MSKWRMACENVQFLKFLINDSISGIIYIYKNIFADTL